MKGDRSAPSHRDVFGPEHPAPFTPFGKLIKRSRDSPERSPPHKNLRRRPRRRRHPVTRDLRDRPTRTQRKDSVQTGNRGKSKRPARQLHTVTTVSREQRV